MKIRWYRYDIDRPRGGLGHKYTTCKMSLSIIMALCIKQRLSNVLSSINEKVKQLWGSNGKIQNKSWMLGICCPRFGWQRNKQ